MRALIALIAGATALALAVPAADGARNGLWSGHGFGNTGTIDVSFVKKGDHFYRFSVPRGRVACSSSFGFDYPDIVGALRVRRGSIRRGGMFGKGKIRSGRTVLATKTVAGTFRSSTRARGVLEVDGSPCYAIWKWRASWRGR
jgi:hypothetical protein